MKNFLVAWDDDFSVEVIEDRLVAAVSSVPGYCGVRVFYVAGQTNSSFIDGYARLLGCDISLVNPDAMRNFYDKIDENRVVNDLFEYNKIDYCLSFGDSNSGLAAHCFAKAKYLGIRADRINK